VTTVASGDVVRSGSIELLWHPASRLAVLRFTADTSLTGNHGAVLVDSLRGWVGASDEPFALLADAKPVTGTDGAYRTATGTQGIAA
jgi:hypothetical protein